jgi:lipopolysaccharide biosynthesis glycosyltransferase
MKTKEKTTTVMIRSVPEHIKKRYKIYCLANGITMQDEILKHMEEVSAEVFHE